eukprot:gene28790-35712_t
MHSLAMESNPVQDKVFESVAELFSLLSTPIRLKIISAVCHGEKNVSELLEEIDTTQPNMSQHLSTLYRSGVLSKRREGTQIYYKLQSERVAALCAGRGEKLMQPLLDELVTLKQSEGSSDMWTESEMTQDGTLRSSYTSTPSVCSDLSEKAAIALTVKAFRAANQREVSVGDAPTTSNASLHSPLGMSTVTDHFIKPVPGYTTEYEAAYLSGCTSLEGSAEQIEKRQLDAALEQSMLDIKHRVEDQVVLRDAQKTHDANVEVKPKDVVDEDVLELYLRLVDGLNGIKNA